MRSYCNPIKSLEWRIFFAVVAVHLTMILWMFFTHEARVILPAAKKPLVVKTIVLSPPKIIKSNPTKKEVVKEIPQEKKVTPVKKAVAKEAPKKKKATPVKKAVIKETPKQEKSKPVENKKFTSKQKLALMHLKESVEKLEKKEHKQSSSVEDVPTFTHALQVNLVADDAGSNELIAAVLKREIRLPEKGEVTFFLELSKKGSVKNVHVDASKSEKNRTYVLNRVKHLKFPELLQETKVTITLKGD